MMHQARLGNRGCQKHESAASLRKFSFNYWLLLNEQPPAVRPVDVTESYLHPKVRFLSGSLLLTAKSILACFSLTWAA